MGAVAVGATIYFGSDESRAGRSRKISQAFAQAHELGMVTVLWCYLRNNAFKIKGPTARHDYHTSADLTGQANHLGVTIQADIIKQKLADEQRRLRRPEHGRQQLRQVRQADLHRARRLDETARAATRSTCAATRSPTATWAAAPLINSGGESKGAGDLAEAVRTAVINKRAGGMGLISGRKAFQRPMNEGVEAAERDPGRVPGREHHGGVNRHGGGGNIRDGGSSSRNGG